MWAEIWKDIGPRIERVLTTGEATWDEGLLLFLGRSGFLEETYHTFSYSPVPGDGGDIAGMLCVVTEETERVVGARRIGTLRELASALAESKTRAATYLAIERSLGANPYDLPFVLLYLLDETDQTARLACRIGVAEGHPAAPATIRFDDGDPVWPLADGGLAARTIGLRHADLGSADGWRKPARTADVVPLVRHGDVTQAGFLVAGQNPFRPGDPSHRDFLVLLAGQIAAALANVEAFEAEWRRAEALAELDRAKSQFFANVSHEFRTPLTLMLGPLEDLRSAGLDALPADLRSLVDVAHRNAARLLKLVNSLLDFARIEAGRVQANLDAVDLAALTSDLASSFRSATERAGLAFTVDCPPLDAPVYVDREMWETVVLNLLSNALKFTWEGGITVRLAAHGGMAELSVADTGSGIPEHELPRLFERFHRVEGARGRSIEGSGIGLALVQELLRLHQGSLRAESTVGVGSTFFAAVPLGTAHVPASRIAGVGGARAEGVSTRAAAVVAEATRWVPPSPAEVADDTTPPPPSAASASRARGYCLPTTTATCASTSPGC